MRRSRVVDWWLLGTLLPVYLVMLAAGVHAHLSSGARVLPFRVTGAQGAHDYPLVWRLDTPDPAIQRGDRVLRLGNLDLQELSRAEIGYRARPLLREGQPFEVELERGGVRSTVNVEPVPNPLWWWTIPVWASLALTAIFLLLRAPHWHLARRFFASSLLWCSWTRCRSSSPSAWASPRGRPSSAASALRIA